MAPFTTTRYAATNAPVRAMALGLAALITLSVLTGLGHAADRQYDHALWAQADSQPVQVVVVTGKCPQPV